MKNNIISVIVPVYNVEKYMRQCVQSIVEQTYPYLQIILVDDGSTDSSGKICDELARTDERIVVYHKANGGLSDARNYGLDRATGDYVAFVDSDDFLDLNVYERMVQTIQESDADYGICNLIQVDEMGKPLSEIKHPTRVKNDFVVGYDILKKIENVHDNWSYIPVWTKVYKAELFRDIRFPKGKINEDEFVFNKLLSEKIKLIEVPMNGYFYRRTQNTITTSGFSFKNLDLVEAYYERALICDKNHYISNILGIEEATYRLIRKSFQDFSEEELKQDQFCRAEALYRQLLKKCLYRCKCSLKYRIRKMIYLQFTSLYVKKAFGKKFKRN